jgi:hypothetical protein
MNKVMYLVVIGSKIGSYDFEPTFCIIDTTDPPEYANRVRARIVRELQQGVIRGEYSDEEANSMLGSLRVSLYHTGLEDYPSTPEQQAAVYQKFIDKMKEIGDHLKSIGSNTRWPEPIEVTKP